MAHQAGNSVIETVVQLLCENGLRHMADAMRLMLNEAMRIERSQALEADPYQRTEKRRGYANGFKPKTLNTRVGEGLCRFRRSGERWNSIHRLSSVGCEASGR